MNSIKNPAPRSEAANNHANSVRKASAIKRPAQHSSTQPKDNEEHQEVQQGGGRARKKNKTFRRSNSNVPAAPAVVSNNGSSTEENSSSSSSSSSNNHPFPYLLRCDRSKGGDQPSSIRLLWHSPYPHVPMAAETALIPVLLHWKTTEGGMAKRLPSWRLRKIEKACNQHGVTMGAALSLRRHHIRKLHPNKSLERLGLGREPQVRESARRFEQCVQEFLDQNHVQYWNETDQGKHNNQYKLKGEAGPPTPDFILKEEILILKYRDGKQGHRNILEERRIGWMEAKMFYGASTIPLDQKSAVGNLLATAEKYVRFFGSGAMVFMNGCGAELAALLSQVGVIVLDCHSPETVSLRLVEDHQRTWCANEKGEILP